VAIAFYPVQCQVLMCDFGAGGFIAPEMVKRRPVVVLSHKRYNAHTCVVVPLSTTPPNPQLPYHCLLQPVSLPRGLQGSPSWVKGNMVAHVALHRLDRMSYRRASDGVRMYESTLVCPADWAVIQACIKHALGC